MLVVWQWWCGGGGVAVVVWRWWCGGGGVAVVVSEVGLFEVCKGFGEIISGPESKEFIKSAGWMKNE